MPDTTAQRHDPYAAFRYRDYRLLTATVFLSSLLITTQAVAVGWDLYERTGSAMALGFLGLAQFAPIVALFIPAGELADRFDRRKVVIASFVLWGAASVGLAVAVLVEASIAWIYFWVGLSSSAQVVNRPARDALVTQIVPAAALPNAIVWNTSLYQIASVSGPALAGLLIAVFHSASPVYAINAAGMLVAICVAPMITRQPLRRTTRVVSWRDLFAGVAHVWGTRLILSVIAIDLLAVLFGGAVALLPIYAKDILHVGPSGLGWLSAAPAVGAVTMGMMQSFRPPLRRAGPTFLWCVGGFGVATVIFGLSTSFWVSLLALVAIGAVDNISVVVRQTVVQLHTPDELRGRVSAVNRVFIGSSNELGAFESGAVAALTTPVFAVVSGGVLTVLLVLAGVRAFPELRRLGPLNTPPEN
jgi:MFS family permease